MSSMPSAANTSFIAPTSVGRGERGSWVGGTKVSAMVGGDGSLGGSSTTGAATIWLGGHVGAGLGDGVVLVGGGAGRKSSFCVETVAAGATDIALAFP